MHSRWILCGKQSRRGREKERKRGREKEIKKKKHTRCIIWLYNLLQTKIKSMNANIFPLLFASLLLLSHNRRKCRSFRKRNGSSFHSINIIHLFFFVYSLSLSKISQCYFRLVSSFWLNCNVGSFWRTVSCLVKWIDSLNLYEEPFHSFAECVILWIRLHVPHKKHLEILRI